MTIRRILFFSDPHHPYQDKKAWSILLKAGKAFKPHDIVCLGDLADFGSISRHLKNPLTTVPFRDEILAVRKAAREVNGLGAESVIWIKGNHDIRLNSYINEHAPELAGAFTIEEKLPEVAEWKIVEYKHFAKLGKVYLTHDVGATGRQANFKAMDKFEHSVLTAHTHRIGYVVEGNAVGEYKVAASFGWLGDITKIDYMQRVAAMKDWALGFGVGYHNTKTGIVHIVPVPIVKYTAIVEGKLFTP